MGVRLLETLGDSLGDVELFELGMVIAVDLLFRA